MKFVTNLVLLACAFAAFPVSTAQDVNCTNDAKTIVRFREGRTTVSRKCLWVGLNTNSCSLINVNTRQPIGSTCAKECLLISGCTGITTGRQLLAPIPSGPYISIDKSSKLVTIPRPPRTGLSQTPLNCPHARSGLRRWHDPNTWGGSIPQQGQNVLIPANSKVLIDQTIVQLLGIVTVPAGSELIIGSNVAGINITATGFDIGGSLIAGSTTCRISTPITITLTGNRPPNASTQIPATTYKGIGVTGLISLHGKRFSHTWTRLSKSVEIGGTVLLLQEPVNWEIGQKIVLVTSAIKDSRDYNQNEVLTVTSVNNNPPAGVGSVVYVKEAAKFRHIANEYYQVEVGLLSRTIKIQGSAVDSEPTDPDPLNCVDFRSSDDWTIYNSTTQPCMNTHRTGFGGHVRIEGLGVGQVEGVEFYRMGQTNVKGRYPFHFHLLGNCPTCYVRDSSFHRSFYRCVSIHGTNNSTVSENVAFDIVGYCYYLEDGVEERNVLSYNLAAHIHTLGPDIPRGYPKQYTYKEGPELTLPADVTASGFYITNVFNYIIGNAASGGWAGFAFPSLPTGLQTFQNNGYRPILKESLLIDGNTAHSTGWWWSHAGAFYIGGTLYYNERGVLTYIPGRDFNFLTNRNPCKVDPCLEPYLYCYGCPETAQSWLQISNTKAFLTAGVGLNSWAGRIEINGIEAHDSRLAVEALSDGFWMDNLLAVCRTGESLSMPSANAYSLEANGFFWYDTNMEHIITRATFRNCGLRSDAYNQYDTSPNRGCSGTDPQKGCGQGSTVFGLSSDTDQYTPQIMQGTKNITFDNCGRRFKFTMDHADTVSGRGQNWLDADGSVSGLKEPVLIGSGLKNASNWWAVDDDTLYDYQAPLIMTKVSGGPRRNIGFIRVQWDMSLHKKVGTQLCGNGNNVPCPPEGYVRHSGPKFSPYLNPAVNKGLPLTARGDVVGPTGGYGWIITFNKGAPRQITFSDAEIYPNSPMFISIPYPRGTKFKIIASSFVWCWEEDNYKCKTTFRQVSTLDEVKNGIGDTYHFANGILTFRMAQTAILFTGNSSFLVPEFSTPSRRPDVEIFSLDHFERQGIVLPKLHHGRQNYTIQAKCPGDTSRSPKVGYCPQPVQSKYDPDVCPSTLYVQVAYDKCCLKTDRSKCVFADGTQNF